MDAKALADAIMAITNDEQTYNRFADGAKKRYQEMFKKEITINNVFGIYNKLWKKLDFSQRDL